MSNLWDNSVEVMIFKIRASNLYRVFELVCVLLIIRSCNSLVARLAQPWLNFLPASPGYLLQQRQNTGTNGV